jgi:hypothetical protein
MQYTVPYQTRQVPHKCRNANANYVQWIAATRKRSREGVQNMEAETTVDRTVVPHRRGTRISARSVRAPAGNASGMDTTLG